MAVPDTSTWDTPLARAMYAYLSSGENQLSFLEGDVIALMGKYADLSHTFLFCFFCHIISWIF